MTQIDRVDLVSGLLMIAIAIIGAVGALFHPLGTAQAMGPGYLPLVFSGVLFLLGLGIIFVEGLARKARETALPPLPLKSLLLIVGSIVSFAQCIERFGLVAAIFSSVILSSLISPDFKLIPTILVCFTLTVMTYVIFVVGLGVPVELVQW
ncbi:MAG: tripartite tricarboxylate transporter TctB family protein [Rhizobiaceae bacterium]|nr:tripartite tricarboxylate transporter TctB family protein [Rhizobiaceae bacterium]